MGRNGYLVRFMLNAYFLKMHFAGSSVGTPGLPSQGVGGAQQRSGRRRVPVRRLAYSGGPSGLRAEPEDDLSRGEEEEEDDGAAGHVEERAERRHVAHGEAARGEGERVGRGRDGQREGERDGEHHRRHVKERVASLGKRGGGGDW